MRFWNLLGWVLGLTILIPLGLYILYYIFIGIGCGLGYIFNPIITFFKNRKQKAIKEKIEKAEREEEIDEQWERVSKEVKESGFTLTAKKKKMTPEEEAEHEKRMAKIKRDKIILTIALIIIAMLMLPGIIISLFS